jgi:PHS family inorganic phosphate transporter-like MFS transporter
VAKIGAFIGVLFLNAVLAGIGFSGGMYVSFAMSVVGLILTAVCIKEPARKALEEAGMESNWVAPESRREMVPVPA